jgi:hypothetical protein
MLSCFILRAQRGGSGSAVRRCLLCDAHSQLILVLATSQIWWRKIGCVRISACACRVHFCPVGGLYPGNLTAMALWSLLLSNGEPCLSVLCTQATGQASACSTVEPSRSLGRTSRCWSALVFYLHTHPCFRRPGDTHDVSRPRWARPGSVHPWHRREELKRADRGSPVGVLDGDVHD